MKKMTILLLIAIGVCLCRLGMAFPQNKEAEIYNIFIERQEAFKREDYSRLWEFEPEYEKDVRFKNDIEEMKIWIKSLPPDGLEAMYKEKIINITFITPNRAYVETNPLPQFGGYYLTKEDEKWRFDIPSYRYELVLRQLQDIGLQIIGFYKSNGKLPKDMEEIIEFDPQIKNYYDLFDDENKPYRFIATAEGWKLYSLGPDSKDDGGEVVYDQTKGLFSAGDIVLTEKDFE